MNEEANFKVLSNFKCCLISNAGILFNYWVLWMASHIIHQWDFHISISYKFLYVRKNYTKQFLQLALLKYKTRQHCLIWSSCLFLPFSTRLYGAWKETISGNLIGIMLGWLYLWFLECFFLGGGFEMRELMWICHHQFCLCCMNVLHVCALDVNMDAWLHVYHLAKFCRLEFTCT